MRAALPSPSPHLLLALTALFWAGHWIVARAVVPYTTPVGMAFWRWAAALAVLAPFAIPPLVRDWPAYRRAWRPILFFGTCGTVLYNAVGYTGIQYSTATNAVVLNTLTPALIPLFGWALFRERIRRVTAAGLAVACIGVLAVVSRLEPQRLLELRVNPGDFWLLGMFALWALYTACLRWKPKGLHPYGYLFAITLAGMLTGLPGYLVDLAAGGRFEANAGSVLGILYLGALPSALCYVMWDRGVAAIGPARAGAYLYLIPLMGAFMAVLFLGESIRAYHAVGLVLIVGGVWLATRRR